LKHLRQIDKGIHQYLCFLEINTSLMLNLLRMSEKPDPYSNTGLHGGTIAH